MIGDLNNQKPYRESDSPTIKREWKAIEKIKSVLMDHKELNDHYYNGHNFAKIVVLAIEQHKGAGLDKIQQLNSDLTQQKSS